VTLAELIAEYSAHYLPTIPDSAPLYRRHLEFWTAELGEHFADARSALYLAMVRRSLPEIMQALGHKSEAAALRYIHLADTHKREVSAGSQLDRRVERFQPFRRDQQREQGLGRAPAAPKPGSPCASAPLAGRPRTTILQVSLRPRRPLRPPRAALYELFWQAVRLPTNGMEKDQPVPDGGAPGARPRGRADGK
jgi:hypothetical protein